jgi:hypothetical protein
MNPCNPRSTPLSGSFNSPITTSDDCALSPTTTSNSNAVSYMTFMDGCDTLSSSKHDVYCVPISAPPDICRTKPDLCSFVDSTNGTVVGDHPTADSHPESDAQQRLHSHPDAAIHRLAGLYPRSASAAHHIHIGIQRWSWPLMRRVPA